MNWSLIFNSFSDHASSNVDEEGKVSDLESASPDCEELLDVDQTYRETIHSVRSLRVGLRSRNSTQHFLPE